MKTRRNKGGLFVVSAPSGAGKTTLCKKLTENLPGIMHSVSFTTRKPRPGETNGKDYHFVDENDFMSMINRGEFVEWAKVHGNLYGTSRKAIEETLSGGTDVILDIDVQGAKQLKNAYKGAIYIFVLPPSFDALKERLTGRMSDTSKEVGERLETARREIKEYVSYDYVIINDMLVDALKGLEAIVVSNRLRKATIESLWVESNFLK